MSFAKLDRQQETNLEGTVQQSNKKAAVILKPITQDTTIDFKRYYTYGLLINIVPLYMFYPIRTVKTLQQANIGTRTSTSPIHVLRERWLSEGVRGLYKGIIVYGAGNICGRLIHFATYDALRERIHKGKGSSVGLGWLENKEQSTVNGVLGTISAVITSSVMVPFDVIAQQLQVSKGTPYAATARTDTRVGNYFFNRSRPFPGSQSPTFASATSPISLNNIAQPTTGNLITRLKPKDVPLHRFLYRGWPAAIVSSLSFFPAYFYTYTFVLEKLYANSHNLSFSPTSQFVYSVAAGIVGGITGTVVSAPADVIKTRIQIARKSGQSELRWFNVAKMVVRTEGIRGLFVGVGARLSIIIPLGSLNFWAFEKVREWSIVKIKNTDGSSE